MKVWKAFNHFVKKLSKISAWIAAITTIFMALLIFIEIVCRSFFGFSTLIADEYGSYFLCASIFFAGPALMATDGFLRVDIVYLRLHGIVKKICDIFIWTSGIICCVFMFRFCLHVVKSSAKMHSVSPYVTKTPMVYPQSIMLIGFALLILEMIVKLGEVFFQPINDINKEDENV